jgi:hypothetical protein
VCLCVYGYPSITPAATRRTISSSCTPSRRESTSLVCSPSYGGARETALAVRLNFTGGPTSFTRPEGVLEWGMSTTMSLWLGAGVGTGVGTGMRVTRRRYE